MKIAVLMGSPRKKDSYQICRLVEKSFSKPSGVEFEFLFLRDFFVEDCRGCDQCFQKGEQFCPCKDELPAIKDALLNADGIIFASPVYACQITGLMKRTLDRLSYLFHRQEFVGKPALTVVTTGGGGLRPAGKYLKMTACGWGCNLVGEIHIKSPLFFKSKNQTSAWGYNEKYHGARLARIEKVTRRFEAAAMSVRPKLPTFYDIFMFQCLRSKTYVSKADHGFWREKGWLEADYFYPVKLGASKTAFSRIMKAYVDRAAKKMLGTQAGPS